MYFAQNLQVAQMYRDHLAAPAPRFSLTEDQRLGTWVIWDNTAPTEPEPHVGNLAPREEMNLILSFMMLVILERRRG